MTTLRMQVVVETSAPERMHEALLIRVADEMDHVFGDSVQCFSFGATDNDNVFERTEVLPKRKRERRNE